jgi:hypothetical protein
MRPVLALSLSGASAAWLLLGCAGRVDPPPLPVLGSGGESASPSGGATGSGGTGGIVVTSPGDIVLPTSHLADDCALAAQSTEYGRAHAEAYYYHLDAFSDADTSLPSPTHLPDAVGGMGGAIGCPSASELDWSCQVGEGRCCPTPQCELPEYPGPVNGKCGYIVYRACGV